jgi:hypothetical protein
VPALRSFALATLLIVGGCAAPSGQAPSLAPRTAEAIDPRLPVDQPTAAQAVDPALAARLANLVGQARSGEAAFVVAAGQAERLAAAAGAREGEAWVIAQQALSAAIAAREPTTKALGDIDGIAAAALAAQGGIAPASLAAINAAAAEVAAIDRRQAQAIDSLQRRLGG